MRVHTFIDQAGLAHPGLTNHRHHLPVSDPARRAAQHQRRALRVAADKAGELQAAVAWRRRRMPLAPISSKTSRGAARPFTGTGPERV